MANLPDANWVKLSGTLPVWCAPLDPAQWRAAAQALHAGAARLVALWGSDERDRDQTFLVRAALQDAARLLVLELRVPAAAPVMPSLAALFPAASRMERALYDLLGVRALEGDQRQWLRHAAWPADQFPLRRDFVPMTAPAVSEDTYAFVRVEGDGVHEIAVGPVHAGIIEPGHFRFSVVGEKTLRLEQRLGYTHKGIEKRFEQLSQMAGQRLAARVSGDSAVAFSWAYCMALENVCSVTPSPRALHLRALALERERIANHLGDLGALGNDAGFAVGLAQFSRLKEDLLRLNADTLGARYPFDLVVPGGVASDVGADACQALATQSAKLAQEVAALRRLYDQHAGMQDRFIGAGVVSPALAARLGVTGLAGRASERAFDLRCDLAVPPYDRLAVNKATHRDGDVAARVAVRFDETLESLRLCQALLRALPAGVVREPLPDAGEHRLGIGLIEGWRGPVLVALETGPAGTLRRCHPHDPSWHNWPVLEHAVVGNIVPDFPLINKSFNLSYSGHDL